MVQEGRYDHMHWSIELTLWSGYPLGIRDPMLVILLVVEDWGAI